MVNVFLKLNGTIIRTYEVPSPFAFDTSIVTNDVLMIQESVAMCVCPPPVMLFTVSDIDNNDLYKVEWVDVKPVLKDIPFVPDVQKILRAVHDIENWAGQAYQSDDEVDLALLAIRKEIRVPR